MINENKFTRMVRKSNSIRITVNHLLNGKKIENLFYGLDISIFDMFNYNWLRKHDTRFVSLLNQCILNNNILDCLYEDVNNDAYDLRTRLNKMRAIERYEKKQILDERKLMQHLNRI